MNSLSRSRFTTNQRNIICLSVSRFVIILLSLTSSSFPQQLTLNDSSLAYYPLQNGMKWIYHFVRDAQYPGTSEEFDFTREVLKDTVLDDTLLYKKINLVTPNWQRFEFFRIDTLTGFVESQHSDWPFRIPVSLYMNLGDTLFQFGGLTFTMWDSFEKWGINALQKNYQFTNTLNECCYYLVKGIGIDSLVIYYDFGIMTHTLKGVVINGISYGDTTVIVSVDEGNKLPYKFFVHQNYPNPFNPTTNIKYELNIRSVIKISVYDILGNELAVLENEEKYPGMYSVQFNGSNLSSGIYFYKIQTADAVIVKRMMLMK